MLIVASNIGTILSATLVNDHPVALIALSARIRHLLLAVAAGIDPLPYFLSASSGSLSRRSPSTCSAAGTATSGLRWLERQAGGHARRRSAGSSRLFDAASRSRSWS